MPILPLLAAGASLAGQVMTNQQNSANTAATNRMNYRIFQEQNQYNLEQWQRNNEYNTPKNQRLRYEEAGINPYLALSNITPGMSQASTSSSANAMQAAHADNPIAPAVDAYNSSMSSYIANKQADTQVKLAEAEIANKQADTAGKLINNDNLPEYLKKQIELLVSNAVKNYSDANRNDALTPVQAEQIKANVEEIKSRIDMSKLEQKIKSYELKNLLPAQRDMFIATIREKTAQLGLISSQIGLNQASATEALSRQLMFEAQTKGINISNDIAKKTANDVVQTIQQNGKLVEAQTEHQYNLSRVLGVQADRMNNGTDIYLSMFQSLTNLAGGMYSSNLSYDAQMQGIQSNNVLGNARIQESARQHNDRMRQQMQMHNDKMDLNWQNHLSRTRKK